MSAILDKLKATSTIKQTSILSESEFFQDKEFISTEVPMLNVALSGRLEGGFIPGLTMIAGPSKHFKTSFALVMAAAFLEKYPDGAILFYDTEFGSPQAYFEMHGIDISRVMHTPITDIELLRTDIANQVKALDKNDHVMIIIDSIGNVASKKETDDALDGKSAADMTRAKQLKSLFRIITPHLNMKDIPLVVINHIYMEMGLYPKAIVGGGTGSYYSSDTIFIVGRQQEKDGTDVVGYNFVLNVEKSRFVKEKSKITINVTWEEGINKFSGLLEEALESGHVIKPKVGWYRKASDDTKSYRAADTNCQEFWNDILCDVTFQTFIAEKYSI